MEGAAPGGYSGAVEISVVLMLFPVGDQHPPDQDRSVLKVGLGRLLIEFHYLGRYADINRDQRL